MILEPKLLTPDLFWGGYYEAYQCSRYRNALHTLLLCQLCGTEADLRVVPLALRHTAERAVFRSPTATPQRVAVKFLKELKRICRHHSASS